MGLIKNVKRILEAVGQRCSIKKVFLEISQNSLEISQNSQENTCARVSLPYNFIKKETLAQLFSCEFYEISKSTFFAEHLWIFLWILRHF